MIARFPYVLTFATERTGGVWSEQLIYATNYSVARHRAHEIAMADGVAFKTSRRLRPEEATAYAAKNGMSRHEVRS